MKQKQKREIERRNFVASELRVADTEGGMPKITGHAAVFDTLSEPLWGFREKIERGAFKGALDGDVRALWNHDSNFVLGRTKSKTLRLAEDDKGLAIEIEPPDAQWARDLIVSMRRGDVTQMSFGFFTITDEWQTLDGETVRTLKEVELYDVSPVTYPAYPQTDVAVRAFEAFKKAQAPDTESYDLRARIAAVS